jgi:hypothetical protein
VGLHGGASWQVAAKSETERRSRRDMKPRPTLSELTVEQLRKRAAEFRGMAATATTADIRDALLRVAERFDVIAAERTVAWPE